MIGLAYLILHLGRRASNWGWSAVDIIWHLGVHRTGSTTLQRFAEANHDRLAAAGIDVWTPGRTRAGLFTGLIHAPADLTADQIRRGERAAGLIGIETARLAALGTKALIVSEENMTGSIVANLRAERLYPDFIARIARLRGAFGQPVRRVGLAIRSYDTYWASALTFAIARGRSFPTTDDLDRLVTQPRRWRDLIRGLASTLPDTEIVVWPFERFAGDPARTLSYLSTIPLPARLEAAEWSQQSPDMDVLREILAARNDAANAASLPSGNGRWTAFDDDQAAALRAEYAEDIAWLRAGAEGCAIFHDSLPAMTGHRAYSKPTQTETKVSGANLAPFASQPRPTRGQDHGTQGHVA